MSTTTPDGEEPVVPTPPAAPTDAPRAPAYEPPVAPPAYEPPAAPAAPAYTAPPAPAPPAYEQPPAYPGYPPAAYGAPSAYGTPPAPAYGTPPAPAYGTPPAPAYGTPPAPAYGAYASAEPKTNTLAIVSLIAAVVGVFVIPFIGSVVAVITGHMSLSQIKRTGERGRGMGLAGTIVGWVGIGLSIIGLIIVIAWIAWFTANSPSMRMYS